MGGCDPMTNAVCPKCAKILKHRSKVVLGVMVICLYNTKGNNDGNDNRNHSTCCIRYVASL